MTRDDMTTEESQVEELRERMKGQMKQKLFEDDHLFKRFLRARNHNIDAAETMLKNHMKWRSLNRVDSLLQDYVPHKFMSSEYITISRLGTDLEGSQLTYLHFGHLDTRGMVKAAKYHDIQQYVIHHLEFDLDAMKKHNEKTGQFVDKCAFIFNFDGFSLASATHKQTLETFLNLLKMYEANFPETLKIAFVINVSHYFFLLWAVLKPFLSAETVRKIQIFGKTGWQEELLRCISPDVLPKFLGGNLTDPDGNPMCKTMLRLGGPIPESFFEYANQPISVRLPGAKHLTVGRLSKVEVALHVTYPGSALSWEFVVRGPRDVEFSVVADGGKAAVSPRRVDTSAATESGTYRCKTAGKYILVFDNTYSWMHGKEIYYTATVAEPQKQLS